MSVKIVTPGSGCCAVDSLLQSSLNLAFRRRMLDDIFIFGMAYCQKFFGIQLGALLNLLKNLEFALL